MATTTLYTSFSGYSWGGGLDDYPGDNTTISHIEATILDIYPYSQRDDINQDGIVDSVDVTSFELLPSGTFPIHDKGSYSLSGTYPPGGSTITSVGVYTVSTTLSGGSPKIKPYLVLTQSGGTTTGAEVTVGTNTQNLARPGGGSWTSDDLYFLYPGVWLRSAGAGHAKCTLLRVTVTYTAPEAPTVSSAATNAAGTVITITFNKAMANPSGKHSQFKYKIGAGADQAFSAAALNADTSKIDLTCSGTAIAYGNTVTVKYTAGDVIAADSGVLATFSNQAVTNNMSGAGTTVTPGVLSLTLTFYAPTAITGNTPTPSPLRLTLTFYAPTVTTGKAISLTLLPRNLNCHLPFRNLGLTLSSRKTALTLPLVRR